MKQATAEVDEDPSLGASASEKDDDNPPLLARTGPQPSSSTTTSYSKKIVLRVLILLFLAVLWLVVTGVLGPGGFLQTSSQVETKAFKKHNQTASVIPKESVSSSSYVANHYDGSIPMMPNNKISDHKEEEEEEETTIVPGATISSAAANNNRSDNTGRIVISMKTMPGRIAYIQPTLDSLLFQQTQKADQFYLVLPEQPKDSPPYIIPTFLNQYIQRGLIPILRPSFDYGAIDKILHTLPEEEKRFQQQQRQQLERHEIRILYLDDDMIYDPSLVQLLASKSDQYPDSVVALSGANLRSHFRQIGHSDLRKNRHPYLYYYVGGVDRFGDPVVDIVQGFMGVMVRLSFFDPNVSVFVDMAKEVVGNNNNNDSNKTTTRVPDAVRRSDDFVICGYLEYRGVPRRCVDGGGLKPVSNPVPSKIGNLGKTMNRNAMGAVTYLQSQWNIWQNYSFVHLETLPENIQHLIDCEAGRVEYCPTTSSSQVKDALGKPRLWKVTELLDELLLNHME